LHQHADTDISDEKMATTTHPYGHKPIHYDRVRHRLWIFGQRCHHGATGMFLTFCGAVGVALMAHDWKDRSVWFARGSQED
jgi:acyl dehydratase